jgi:hypothetical protein
MPLTFLITSSGLSPPVCAYQSDKKGQVIDELPVFSVKFVFLFAMLLTGEPGMTFATRAPSSTRPEQKFSLAQVSYTGI